MKVWTALACAVLLCQVLSGVTAQQCANPDCAGAAGTVVDLGASFKTLAAVKEAYKGKILLTKFFAPWCGHCKKMAPAWVDLAKDVKDSTDVVVSEVDCTVHKDLCAEAGVRGYPTILAFKDGSEPAKHSGARDVAGFKAWIEKLSAPPAEEKPSVAAAHTPGEVLVLGDDSFKATTALPKLTLVKMFAPWCGHCKNMAEAWVELAKEVKDNADIVIAEMDCTTNEAACEAAGVEGYPTIKAFKAGKDLGEHEGARDVAAFKAWINKLNGGATEEAKEDAAAELPEGTAATLTPGEVLTLGDSTFKATSAAAKLMVVKMYAPWCGHCKRMAEAWVELAKEMKDNADVVVAEVDCTTNEAACKAAGVRGYPTILAFKQGEQAGKHSGSRDLASLKAWVEKLSKPADAAAADDKPSVAATATPGEVLVLTDADFKGTIAQADKLVAVKMFAPWCGHCKKMAEAWVELAKEVKDNANVVIAEVDCTVHQAACEAAGVEGYPTIKAFKAGKDLGEHEGARDLASLKKFIEGKL